VIKEFRTGWPAWCSTTSTATTKTQSSLANRQRLDIGERMAHQKIYEDHRTFTRAELATELHRLAIQLESGDEVTYGESGAGASIAVPEQIERELEIEPTKDGAGVKFELEIKWTTRQAESPVAS
jgi:amphi-Trp domain-containing protein